MAMINGRIDQELLFPVASGERDLLLNPMLSWNRLKSRVDREFGWPLIPSPGWTCYRSLEQQIKLFYSSYTTTYTGYGPSKQYNGKTWWRKTADTPSAATPGKSNHGYGNAVDIAGMGGLNNFSDPQYKQLLTIAGPYGWDNNEGKSIGEPWHWVYKIANDQYLNTPGGDEDDMDQATFNSLMTGFLTSSAGKKVLNAGTTGGDAYYQTTNPLTGEVESIIINLNGQYSYAVKTFLLADKILKAVAQIDSVTVDVDEAAIAKDISAVLVPAVVKAVTASTTLTAEEVEAACEEAIKDIFGPIA
jgi:hypothetical protein